jgi:hypothetical protein
MVKALPIMLGASPSSSWSLPGRLGEPIRGELEHTQHNVMGKGEIIPWLQDL